MSPLTKASEINISSDNNGISKVPNTLLHVEFFFPGLARKHSLNPCAEIFVPRVLPASNSESIEFTYLSDPKPRNTEVTILNTNDSKVSINAMHTPFGKKIEAIRINDAETFITTITGYENFAHFTLPSDDDDSSIFFPFIYFCITLTIVLCAHIIETYRDFDTRDENDRNIFQLLQMLRLKNPKKVTIGHLNINSIRNKFDGIMDLVAVNLDVFLISETKIDDSFPEAQFFYEGYSKPHRRDRTQGEGGGLLMYVNQNIPSRTLNTHIIPDDIELICVELNLKKQKWVIIGIYRPPSMNERYFFDNLSRLVDYYNKNYDRLVIMGDFNSEPADEHVQSFCYSYNLHNLVKENTCFKGPPKCYDLIITNCKYSFQNTMALTSGFSDFHKMTVTVLKTEYVKSDPLQINYRDYKNFNANYFNDDLMNELNTHPDSNKDYHQFQSALKSVLDIHAPQKKIYVRANNSAFMTKQLRKLIMNRSRCKNKYFKNKNVENWERYRKLRNECVNLTKKTKKDYFTNLSSNSVNDTKTFWKTIKPFFSDKNKKSQKIILVENHQIIKDDKKNTDILNSYFVNITDNLNIPEFTTEKVPCNTIDEDIDPIDNIIYKYSKHPSILKIRETTNFTNIFSFNKVNERKIKNEILELNSKKSAGYDTIPPKIIKDSIEIVTPSLTNLFNISVDESIFPTDLKYANVAPIFKKNDSTSKENYRPISILPSVSKIFERILFQQISSYVSSILSPFLCGFRKGYNAQHALLRLKNKLNICLDKKEKIGLFMMDLSKAFDCIPHELMIAKLHAYKFDKNCLKLIYSYLKGRKQRVKINSEFSTWKEILNGVPQGSVLGPLLFNIFINDLFFFVDYSDICNYADDNSLTVADICIDKIVTKIQCDVNKLGNWFKCNMLLLNESKCQFMIIEPEWVTRNNKATINIADKSIEETNKGKLLGITFDSKLIMSEHIKQTCKQASRKLSALARIAHYIDKQKRKILMKSFIISQFNYCPIVWMYCQRKSNRLINRIHERALRIAYNDYVSDFDLLLQTDNAVTIHHRNIQALTLEIYKSHNNLNPTFMKEVFRLKQTNYSLRHEGMAYPNPRTVSYGLETFGYRGGQLWHNLPEEVRKVNDILVFKKYVATHCKDACNCNLCKNYVANLGYLETIN